MKEESGGRLKGESSGEEGEWSSEEGVVEGGSSGEEGER